MTQPSTVACLITFHAERMLHQPAGELRRLNIHGSRFMHAMVLSGAASGLDCAEKCRWSEFLHTCLHVIISIQAEMGGLDHMLRPLYALLLEDSITIH